MGMAAAVAFDGACGLVFPVGESEDGADLQASFGGAGVRTDYVWQGCIA